jgi:hypothetical protein
MNAIQRRRGLPFAAGGRQLTHKISRRRTPAFSGWGFGPLVTSLRI